jgi:hypothetical protein
VAAAGLSGCAAVALRDPHVPGSWGFCPFLAVTGLPCPLCGGLRAVHDLMWGRLGEALSANLLVVAGLVIAAGAVLWWGARRATGTGSESFPLIPGGRSGALGLVVLVVLLVGFGAGRWLPPLAWAAP